MTLRARLLVSVLAIFATLAVAGMVVAQSQRRFLVEQVDERLEAAIGPAQAIARDELDGEPVGRDGGDGAGGARGVDGEGTGGEGTGASDGAPDGPAPDLPGPTALSELYVGLVDAAGELTTLFAPGLSAVPSLSAAQLAAAEGDAPFAPLRPFTVHSGGESFRMAIIDARGGEERLVVGYSLGRVESASNRLLLGFGGAGLAALAVTGLAAWWVHRLGLRPIKDMTEAADAIARGEVGRRVEHLSPRTEAGRLGLAFNVMLDERQGVEARLRRFVSDASHELRTPLTSIRGYVDLYRKGGLRGDGELDDAMRRIAGEGARMGTLVEDLLLLARLDEGRPLADEPVDLAVLLRDAAGDAAALHPTRAITVEVADRLPVRGDEARLRQVIGALVTNALVHTPPGTAVAVAGRNEGDVDVVEVRDVGGGMPPELAATAFERFTRGDPARTRHTGGSGLGLSIVRSIVEAHGGRVALATTPGAGTTVRVELPSQPA